MKTNYSKIQSKVARFHSCNFIFFKKNRQWLVVGIHLFLIILPYNFLGGDIMDVTFNVDLTLTIIFFVIFVISILKNSEQWWINENGVFREMFSHRLFSPFKIHHYFYETNSFTKLIIIIFLLFIKLLKKEVMKEWNSFYNSLHAWANFLPNS